MAKYLYYFLSFHHLFNIAVQIPNVLLLLYKILPSLMAEFRSHKQHKKQHHYRNNRQRQVEYDHADKCHDHRKCRIDNLWKTLADKLAQRIHIIGIDRHNVSVGVRIKILDRQRFHMLK